MADMEHQQPCFVIVGKPGSGKSTLAKHIADDRGCELISASTVLVLAVAVAEKKAIADAKIAKKLAKQAAKQAKQDGGEEGNDDEDDDEDDEEEEEEEEDDDEDEDEDVKKPRIPESFTLTDEAVEARNLLISGKPVPHELLMTLIEQRVASPTVKFRGYVLDGLITEAESTEQFNAMVSRIQSWSSAPNYIINVDISDEDLRVRLTSQRCDPATGALYVSTQIEPPQVNGEEEEEEDDEDEDEEEDEDDEDAGPPVEAPPPPTVIKARPLISQEQYDLGIQRAKEVDRIKHYSEQIGEGVGRFYNSFREPSRFTTDANVSDHELASSLLTAFATLSLPSISEPIVMEPTEDDDDDAEDQEMLDAMCGSNLPEDDDEPPEWRTSLFGRYCPVSLVEPPPAVTLTDSDQAKPKEQEEQEEQEEPQGKKEPEMQEEETPTTDTPEPTEPTTTTTDGGDAQPSDTPTLNTKQLVKGKAGFGVIYAGHVYAMANKAAQEKFRVCPTKYTNADPTLLKTIPLLSPIDKAHEYDDEDENADAEYGLTRQFCPVVLKRKHVLQPGPSTDCAAKYLGKWYHLSSDDARDEFLENPSEFLSNANGAATTSNPPPPRICLLGGPETAKAVHGRRIARRHRMFHVSFEELLNEIAEDPTSKHHEVVKELLGEDKTELEAEVILELVTKYWTEEPYQSNGVVIDGFPRNEEDAKIMAEASLFPDIVVALTMEGDVAVRRALPKAMKAFNKERDYTLAKRAKIAKEKAEAKAKRKLAWEEQRAIEKAKTKAEGRAARLAELGPDATEADLDDEEDEDEDDDDEWEDDEEEEEEDDELEPIEEAQERFTEEITEKHDEMNESASGLVEFFKDELKVASVEVSAARREDAVRRSLETRLAPFVGVQRRSIFEYVRLLTWPAATALLKRGLVKESQFGSWCPVALHDGDAVQPILGGQYAAIYANQVFFMSTHDHRTRFAADPLLYINQPAPLDMVPVRASVLGAPKSGKTTLAKRLCDVLGAKYVSAVTAIGHVITNDPTSTLALALQQGLRKGGLVSDAHAVEAVCRALRSVEAQTQGYVLDDFPQNETQMSLLESAGIHLMSVINLESTTEVRLQRAVSDAKASGSEPELQYQRSVFEKRDSAYEQRIASVHQFYHGEYGSWTTIDGTMSKWSVTAAATTTIKTQLKQMQKYLCSIEVGDAAPIAGVGFSFGSLQSTLGQFGQYCPVDWVDNARLTVIEAKSVAHTVVYEGKHYKLSNQAALDAFTADPAKYLSQALPDHLPVRRNAREVESSFPRKVAFGGFCPVNYVDNRQQYDYLKPGLTDCAVEYVDEFYVFVNSAAQDKFMCTPQSYATCQLPAKVPPKPKVLDVNKLPMLGYMEQTVALYVTKAIAAVGLAKPKYPGLDMTQSGTLFIALYLKATNPRATPYSRQIARQRLREFERKCDLVKYLGNNSTQQFDGDRPTDFQPKLTEFLTTST